MKLLSIGSVAGGIGDRRSTETGESASQRSRLLFVVNHSEFFLSHRLPIAVEAREQGYEVIIATGPSPAAERVASLGFEWRELPLVPGGTNPITELGLLLHFIRLFRSIRPDVVHLVTIKPILFGGLAARLAGVPAVVYALSGLGYLFISRERRARLLRTVVRRLLPFALAHKNGAVIVQNADDRRDVIENVLVPGSRVALIRGSGADMQRFRPSPFPEGPPLTVLPSRLLWDKGVGEFVAAAEQLRREGLKARFVLVGDPDPNNPASIAPWQIDSWADEASVEVWGFREDMEEVYRRSHIVCLPSYREGLPKSLIEGAAAGRPLVATDVPGCREVVEHGRNGYLVPPRDPTALATALKQLILDAKLRDRMGTKSREIAVSNFDVTMVVDQTLRLYSDLRSGL